MTVFTEQTRDKPMWHTVAFHHVPVFRAPALALDHAQDHCAQFAIFSADRRLYPANSPGTASDCLHADGMPAYRVDGKSLAAAETLPAYMLGIDAVDHGSTNDCSRLVGTLERLGYHVTRPYHSGPEAHHMVFTNDPLPVLRHSNQVPKS
jgi:hypothetical protein